MRRFAFYFWLSVLASYYTHPSRSIYFLSKFRCKKIQNKSEMTLVYNKECDKSFGKFMNLMSRRYLWLEALMVVWLKGQQEEHFRAVVWINEMTKEVFKTSKCLFLIWSNKKLIFVNQVFCKNQTIEWINVDFK